MDGETIRLLIPLSAIILGSLCLLIPIAGLTLRFAIKPVMEAIVKGREAQINGAGRELGVLEQRVALLEQHYQTLESSLDRLKEAKDFERQLSAPKDPSSR
jgi:hypothetical protein